MKRLILVLALLLIPVSAAAQAVPRLPPNFTEELYENGINNPTAMAFAPDGRLFVLEQSGAVRVISAAGTLLGPAFYTFDVDDDGERGLLGIAFDPNFGSNKYIYFYYTDPGESGDNTDSRNRVVRLTANDDVAAPGSEFNVFQLPFLSSAATNHNGGAIHFGLDGKLYAGVGENAIPSLSQDMGTRLGKMLRYNADGSIPTDNPFYGSASGQNRAIWALGLRNPFTFAVQPGTGTIFINDVGSGSWEEINLGEAGANYGWPATEGMHGNPAYENPIYAYENEGSHCAITGGTFYNPPVATFPASYVGDYFFADLCASEINVRDSGGSVTQFAQPTMGGSIVDLAVGPDGALYYISRGADAVYRIYFETTPASGELIVNGSFETDANGNKIPDNWKPVSLNAKRVCNGGTFITDGACALKLRRGSGSGGNIQQKIVGTTIASGTSLDLSAMVSGANVPVGTVIKLKVITVSNSDTLTLPVPTGTYDPMAVSLPTFVTIGQGVKVKGIIKYPDGGGKLFVDEFSIVATPPTR